MGRVKRSQPKRDWSDARAKVEAEAQCRLSRWKPCEGPLEAAHVVGRERDWFDLEGYRTHGLRRLKVEPMRVVTLCRRHHRLYDDHDIDLLGYLAPEEEAQAVIDSCGLEQARVRLAPSLYPERRSAA